MIAFKSHVKKTQIFSIKLLYFGKIPKGQIKPKADWRAVDSPKNQTNEFVFHSKQNKFIHSFFGRIYDAPKLLSVLFDL